jgi:hypothetical protein
VFLLAELEEESKKRFGGRRGKISCLPANVQQEIEDRMVCGETPKQISKWLKSQGYNIGDHCLLDYQTKVKALVGRLRSNFYNTMALAASQEKFDALIEMKKLAQVQMRRLSISLKAEQDKNATNSIVDKGMDLLRGILKDYLEVEMDLGYRERHSSKEGKGISDEQFANVLKEILGEKKPQQETSTASTSSTTSTPSTPSTTSTEIVPVSLGKSKADESKASIPIPA